ncbi:PadR family transcriptional regulator [Streptomyces sp. NPDC002845]
MEMKKTPQLERVLRVFLEDPAAPRYGYELMKAAKLASGTLYPILTRLQDAKLVTSEWETPGGERQRPRRYYKLTGDGVRVARMELQLGLDRASAVSDTARPATGSAS